MYVSPSQNSASSSPSLSGAAAEVTWFSASNSGLPVLKIHMASYGIAE